jgi:hypothetical protein
MLFASALSLNSPSASSRETGCPPYHSGGGSLREILDLRFCLDSVDVHAESHTDRQYPLAEASLEHKVKPKHVINTRKHQVG